MEGSERIIVLAKQAQWGVKRNCLARGDILGTRKRVNGDARKLLTDARETSYWI
jgi:hypothetical protein